MGNGIFIPRPAKRVNSFLTHPVPQNINIVCNLPFLLAGTVLFVACQECWNSSDVIQDGQKELNFLFGGLLSKLRLCFWKVEPDSRRLQNLKLLFRGTIHGCSLAEDRPSEFKLLFRVVLQLSLRL